MCSLVFFCLYLYKVYLSKPIKEHLAEISHVNACETYDSNQLEAQELSCSRWDEKHAHIRMHIDSDR